VKIPHDPSGVVKMWKWVVYAEEEERFFANWTSLCSEFKDQEAILVYLQSQFLPCYHQWAQCKVRFLLNYGQTTTSQSESSNHCIKTYLVSGKVDWYGLAKALHEMIKNQELNYNQTVAGTEIRVRQRYSRHLYLENLSGVLTRYALDMINDQRKKAIAISKAREDAPCDEKCSTWLQFKIPCAHTILEHFKDGVQVPLTLHDVDKRWISNRRVDENHPYLRIQDPPPAEARRGRPRNEPIPVPLLPRQLQQRALTNPGRRAPDPAPEQGNATPRRRNQRSSQQSTLPRPRAGHRGRGSAPSRRLAGSTSRRASSWEEVPSQSSPAARAAQRRQKKTTGGRASKRTTTRKTASQTVVEEEDVDVEEQPEEVPPAGVLRRTRGGRITKPSAKLAAKRRGEAYS
jgi:hypothetical protein